MDTLTRAQRSNLMATIKHKDTKPEIGVRSLIHRLGFRFRLHGRELPGSPDIVLKRHAKVVFVHGCFWHRHAECKRRLSPPASNAAFWQDKFAKNVLRDQVNEKRLSAMGWRFLVVWECETKGDLDSLANKLKRFLAGH
jgi:DNA mismatch endonuclease (patch repair protein)